MKFIKSLYMLVSNPQNWSVDNVLSMISIILVIIGGIFAYRQWKSANTTRRAELINQILEKLRFDKEFAKILYRIDYKYGWYNKSFHEDEHDLEYQVDKLLSYFSYICYLRKERKIRSKEFCILKYEIHRACSSFDIQCYLWNIYHFSQQQGTSCSFQYLIDYGLKQKLIDREKFINSQSTYYLKILNF